MLSLRVRDLDAELEVVNPTEELKQMPLRAIGWNTVEEIGRGLSATVMKIVDHNLTADMKGFINFLGFNKEEAIVSHPSPFVPLIDLWEKKLHHEHRPSVGKLIEILHIFERYDILFDIRPLIEEDLQHWRAKLDKMKAIEMNNSMELPTETVEPLKPLQSNPNDPKAEEPKPDETYDAIFSYNVDSEYDEFIMEDMYASLTTMYRLKLCKNVGTSDLKRYETFRHITSRCAHVIVLLSTSYVSSTDCYADLNFMTVKDPMAYARKIIPVLIQNIKPPDILMDRVCVKYFKKDEKRRCLQSIYEVINSQRLGRI